MAVSAMARITQFAFLAPTLLLLCPAVSLAQDEGQRSEAQTQTAQPQAIERAQGVPDDYTLPPGPTAAPGNRFEPLVQPLPQPSASPTPTPTVAPAPAQQAPRPTTSAAPRQAASSQRQPSATNPGAPRAQPTQQSEQSAPAVEPDVPVAEEDTPPESAAPRTQPSVAPPIASEVSATDTTPAPTSGWSVFAWLLGGIVVLALGALAFWWLRQRKGESFTVEKIEPYRPTPTPPSVQKDPRVDETPPSPVNAQTLAGVVNASRPAPAANPGGFVTSTIASRRAGQQGTSTQTPQAQTPQEPTSRGNMTADGRIVTSLSSLRKRLD